jgi:hypothetical protein
MQSPITQKQIDYLTVLGNRLDYEISDLFQRASMKFHADIIEWKDLDRYQASELIDSLKRDIQGEGL